MKTILMEEGRQGCEAVSGGENNSGVRKNENNSNR